MDAYRLFEQLIDNVNREVATLVFRAGPMVGERSGGDRPPARRGRPQARMDASRARAEKEEVAIGFAGGGPGGRRDPTTKQQPIVKEKSIGRNDPCPCGSGKKYKHCHGRA